MLHYCDGVVFVQSGAPVGLQIVGARNADIAVIAAAALFEDAHPFHEQVSLSPSPRKTERVCDWITFQSSNYSNKCSIKSCA